MYIRDPRVLKEILRMFELDEFLPGKRTWGGVQGVQRWSGNFTEQEGSQNKEGQRQGEEVVLGKVYS